METVALNPLNGIVVTEHFNRAEFVSKFSEINPDGYKLLLTAIDQTTGTCIMYVYNETVHVIPMNQLFTDEIRSELITTNIDACILMAFAEMIHCLAFNRKIRHPGELANVLANIHGSDYLRNILELQQHLNQTKFDAIHSTGITYVPQSNAIN